MKKLLFAAALLITSFSAFAEQDPNYREVKSNLLKGVIFKSFNSRQVN